MFDPQVSPIGAYLPAPTYARSVTQPDRAGARRPEDTPADFSERLIPPVWIWPVALCAVGFAAAEVRLGAPGLATWLPYVVLLPVAAIGMAWLGRIRITVADGELRVDDARLPVRVIESVTVLDQDTKRDLLGPYARPYAFVIQRPWIRCAVKVELCDPEDPTPYWVISSRHPEDLADAIRAARQL